tara:strand:+ start:50 stop:790 length:741 start_codon:yes stop_codon:yes gene_type:complete
MFCKHCGKQINDEAKFCKFCGQKVIQESFAYSAPKSTFLKKINWRKLLLNRYVAILLGVIFIVWISAGDGTSYNSGTKSPLPAPVQQDSSDRKSLEEIFDSNPQDSNNLDLSAFDVSLANGTILKKSSVYLYGDGELQIKNGTSLDAVAKLIRGGTSVLTVYIKANSTYTMTNISDGVYWLAFAQGLNWDSTTQKFRRNVQYSAFEDTFDFETTNTQYTIFEVTLNPVIGGTAETSSVDPAQFNAY